MDLLLADDFRRAKLPGFCFKYCERNEILRKCSPDILPVPTKTGTTSVGIVFSNGVILGSDFQNINNSLRESNAEKLFYLTDNIFCCCAGMAADNYWVSKIMSSDLKLLQLEMKRKCRVVTAVRIAKQILFQYQGFLDVNFIIGGVDINGPQLVTVYPHGSSDKLFYSGIGSGSMPSMSVIENRYKIGLGEKEALELLVDSISSGIYNDLNSGTSINAVVITKDGFTQKVFPVEEKTQSQKSVIVKDFNVVNTEVKRYELITTSEKVLR